ncbi:MAG: biotin/lipoyl-binding protein [Bacteroidaceae bacterium]|nr:biotin/lipoyl-binding protein [Bacteroidaceae bacterium]
MKEYKYKIKGVPYEVKVMGIEENIAKVEVNGVAYDVEMENPVPQPKPVVRAAAAPARAAAPAPAAAPAAAPASSGAGHAVKSPLPGTILSINVNVGDEVKAGQTVLVLEAMKMENNICADRAGKIAAVKVGKGDSVLEGTDLVIIE